MKLILLLIVCLEFLIGSAYLRDIEGEVVKALAHDILSEMQPQTNTRFARHVKVVTETAIDHFLDNLRASYEKRNSSSKMSLRRAANQLRKKMKSLRAKMQKRRSKDQSNKTSKHSSRVSHTKLSLKN